MKTHTETVALDVPKEKAFGFLSDPLNLPQWAKGFCLSIRCDDSSCVAMTSEGELNLRPKTHAALGTIDIYTSSESGREQVIFSRIIPKCPASCAYILTLVQGNTVSDASFAARVAEVKNEVLVLKNLIEKVLGGI